MSNEFDQEALIRSIGISPKGRFILLLGAGASASSGIPTAQQCIWEWKREIYLSGNSHLSPRLFLDVSLPNTQEKIQKWLDQQNKFPRRGDHDEYCFYIEHTYPKSDDRRAFFEKRFSGAIPQIGYQLLAMLQNDRLFQWVWTTNFDGLIMQGRTPQHTRPLKEVGLDTSFRLQDINDEDECGYFVHLHGDYRYDRLKNTGTETRELDQTLRMELIKQVRRKRLIVIGYSGRDESVMSALESAIQQSDGGELYWCVVRNDEVPLRVTSLLDKAARSGYHAHVIETEGFDDVMIRLARFVCREGRAAAEIEGLLSAAVPERTMFCLSGYTAEEDWIKSNGYPIELPQELYQFDVDGIASWKELREALGEAPVVAGLLKGKVLAMGDIATVSKVFGGKIKSKIEPVPLEDSDFSRPDTVTMSVLLQGLARALACASNLEISGKNVIWDPTSNETVNWHTERYKAFPGARLSINKLKGSKFLNFVLDLHVVKEDGSEPCKEAIQNVKRQLLGRQWNQPYHKMLDDWCGRILGSEESRTFNSPPDSEDSFRFKLSRPPAYARIFVKSKYPDKPLVRKPGEIFDAIVLSEPALLFGSIRGISHGKDPHPIRGLVTNGPYDFQLTQTSLYREIRLGVICPGGWERSLSSFLQRLILAHSKVETKAEYLSAYPGFQQAYRIPLRVPLPTDVEWRVLPNVRLSEQELAKSQREIAGAIIREIDALRSLASVDVVLVFVPQTWKPYEVVEDVTVRLDLHDFVKAHGAQNAVRTQLLREETLLKRQQCEIFWWLAQALYVKSLRTPFVLDTDDPETVFVGIGYGYAKTKRGSGVVLGCSHIYDAAGQGLRYQLSKIQNPVWKNKNPYLTKDDAIRVGLQARQLFYDTYNKVPHRVVIHKRTPFLKSEREGLSHALKDVKELEMLTIELEDAWRFIAYDKWKKRVAPFPVKRGTLLIAGSHQAFLWVHGTTRDFIEGERSYFQGKSRIPVPLKLTRFAGHSPIERIANEILGLSKMDWNSYDLYSQMPATLESSGAIARIGQLLSRFGPETYDYRLFI
jgi:NAD-dependent SIR2 family protein deacetylase